MFSSIVKLHIAHNWKITFIYLHCQLIVLGVHSLVWQANYILYMETSCHPKDARARIKHTHTVTHTYINTQAHRPVNFVIACVYDCISSSVCMCPCVFCVYVRVHAGAFNINKNVNNIFLLFYLSSGIPCDFCTLIIRNLLNIVIAFNFSYIVSTFSP